MNKTRTELANFFRKLSTMINAGAPVVNSLEAILKETSDKPMRAMISDLATGIKSCGTGGSGESLMAAMARHPAAFSPSVLSMIAVGEATGSLEKVLLEVAKGIEDETLPFGVASEHEGAALDEPPVTPAINRISSLIILNAVNAHASDIHIESSDDSGLRVRYRIDGVLHDMEKVPAEMGKATLLRFKIMASVNPQEERVPQDGRFQANVCGKEIDVRLSVAPCVTGESIVMRILETSPLAIPTIEQQSFTQDNMETIRGWCRKSSGIVVVTGPTGCGKTTTVYSLLKETISPEVKILTVEDPVAYNLGEGVCQMRVDLSRGVTFASLFRAQMRQDPDIIMVSEIRDLETAQIAVQAALTGHLVLTTLHTSDAPEALRRLLDIGIEPFLVNSTVIGVLSQRLVRKLCPECSEKAQPSDWVRETLKGSEIPASFQSKGCKACNNFGYSGRIAIHEILAMNEKVKAAVARDASLEELREAAIADGMLTKQADGLAKAGKGITTIEEVLSACF